MQRICSTLARQGHAVTLVGRVLPGSVPLENRDFKQTRLNCFFRKGFAFYAEYNLRLFFLLLFAPLDAVCSIDLDTLPAGCAVTLLRRKKRVFDAHEYFTEVPELVNRPFVRYFWEMVARLFLPFYRHAYTVGPALAGIFSRKYRLAFGVVRNVPLQAPMREKPPVMRTIIYQGALNEGRGIEAMLAAMTQLENVTLQLAGEGDLSDWLRQMAKDLKLGDQVQFLGYVKPDDLKKLTVEAWLGINLLENKGLSYYYSLANKYFDYVQAGVPVLTMNFPEYRTLNADYSVAELIDDLKTETIAGAIRRLMENHTVYQALQQQCLLAREEWNWEKEQNALLLIWDSVENT